MVYNKKLTGIHMMVPDKTAAETVGSVIENSVAEWTKSSCTKYSREYITPFKIIVGWPQSKSIFYAAFASVSWLISPLKSSHI
jgi:hypothetical protein